MSHNISNREILISVPRFSHLIDKPNLECILFKIVRENIVFDKGLDTSVETCVSHHCTLMSV